MAYRVVITPVAKRQLDQYVGYTASILKNRTAAKRILEDAKQTKKRLADVAESLALCPNELLAKYGYRRVFFDKHDYFMVYRVEGKKVIVDAMYHELQDYESVFADQMNLE